MGNLALVEEPVEVGLHFGAAGDTQAEGEESAQVLLHGGQLVAVQALLPRLLGPPVLLGEATKITKISHCAAKQQPYCDSHLEKTVVIPFFAQPLCRGRL